MKTLMFYSYKGGSGRSVAAANVAAAFAKLGKRAAIVDLDFEAPGLQHVFAVEKLDPCISGLGIQSYLKGDITFDQLMNVATVDILGMLASKGPLERPRIPQGAELLYIVASTRVMLLDASDPLVGDRMKDLRQALADRGTEILVIDAASGVREAFSIALDACDEMLIFFRWSRQHIAGAFKIADFLKSLRKRKRSKPFRFVASASPSDVEFTAVANERLRSDLSRVKRDTDDKISEKLKECDIEPPEVFHEIPEFLEMKWRESVVVFRDENSTYEIMARKLIDAGL